MGKLIDPMDTLTATLSAEARDKLRFLVRSTRVPAHTALFDAEPDSLLLVYSGNVALGMETANQLSIWPLNVGPGAILGLQAVLENDIEEMTAIAQDTCELGVIEGDQFRSFLREYPETYVGVARLLAQEVHLLYSALLKLR